MTTPPLMNWYNFRPSYPLSVIYHSHRIIWFSIRLVGRFKKVMLSSFDNGPVLNTVRKNILFCTKISTVQLMSSTVHTDNVKLSHVYLFGPESQICKLVQHGTVQHTNKEEHRQQYVSCVQITPSCSTVV